MNNPQQLLFWVFVVFLIAVIMFIPRGQPGRVLALAGPSKVGSREHHKKEARKDTRGDVYKDMVANPRTKSEAKAIEVLKKLTGGSFPTVNPGWLVWGGRTRELDGYNEGLKLALEFSGPLHTKWYPGVEPYEKYFARIVTDVAKRKLCARHGVDLIVIDMSLPQIHWRDYMASRLYDFGRLEQKPWKYIDVQIAKPYRNKQLEDELGLRAEWKAVSKL